MRVRPKPGVPLTLSKPFGAARPLETDSSMSRMWCKIRAACDARRDGDLLIMARTDAAAVHGFDAAVERALQAEYERLFAELQAVRARVKAVLVLETAGGLTKELPLSQVVRADRVNGMGRLAKAGRYAANVWAFVSEDPRESNTEGGVFPAIFGTVLMVLIMSVVVTPLGVLTAFYLREYAKQGPVVSAVRIAVRSASVRHVASTRGLSSSSRNRR